MSELVYIFKLCVCIVIGFFLSHELCTCMIIWNFFSTVQSH